MTNFDMKEFLRRMMTGWTIREASYVEGAGYSMTEEEAMTQAFDGDAIAGALVVLFGNWCNDIQSIAADKYHIAIVNGKVVDIDPPPTDGDYYWYGNMWHKHDPKEVAIVEESIKEGLAYD